MDFDKLIKQREAKAAVTSNQKKKRELGSKRRTWKMRAWYVQPKTARRLRAYVSRQQEGGRIIDASDVVDQAITIWLEQNGG